MKKRIFALLLAAMLPLGAAIADEPLTDGTVLVDWVDGQETYTAICSGELTLRYDADTNTYATADGLIWKTEGALPFATYQPLLMPRTREELLQCNAITRRCKTHPASGRRKSRVRKCCRCMPRRTKIPTAHQTARQASHWRAARRS